MFWGHSIIIIKWDWGNFFLKLGKQLTPTIMDKKVQKRQKTHSNSSLKDTHKEKPPSNKTLALTKSTNMDISFVDTSNQPSIRGS